MSLKFEKYQMLRYTGADTGYLTEGKVYRVELVYKDWAVVIDDEGDGYELHEENSLWEIASPAPTLESLAKELNITLHRKEKCVEFKNEVGKTEYFEVAAGYAGSWKRYAVADMICMQWAQELENE